MDLAFWDCLEEKNLYNLRNMVLKETEERASIYSFYYLFTIYILKQ